MLRSTLLLACCSLLSAATITLDRVAVVVGKSVVKTSDIERDLKLSQFLNNQPPDTSADARRESAIRLIDQELIRQELGNGNYLPPTAADAEAVLTQLRRDRFRGSDDQLRAALQRYGADEDQLRKQLLWQLTVLRFIDQRFRPGVLVTDEEVQTYYNQHKAALQKEYPRDNSLATLTPKIRQSMEGERINQAYEEWVEQARQRTRVQYKQGVF